MLVAIGSEAATGTLHAAAGQAVSSGVHHIKSLIELLDQVEHYVDYKPFATPHATQACERLEIYARRLVAALALKQCPYSIRGYILEMELHFDTSNVVYLQSCGSAYKILLCGLTRFEFCLSQSFAL